MSDAQRDERAAGSARTPALPWLVRAASSAAERRFLFAFVLLLAVLLLPLLGRVPRAYGDDSWSAMAGYTIAFEGCPRNPGQMGRGGTDRYLLQPRLLANVVSAPVYRVIGYGLTQSRLVAVAFCGIFVAAVYGIMRQLFGPLAAAGIALMTAIDPWVFICGRTGREEIFLAALLWLSWWILLEAIDRRSAGWAFVGGALIGLACWTHPNALVFTAAAVVAVVVTAGSAARRGTWWLWAAGGVAAGLAPYVAYVAYVQATTDVRLMDQVAARTGAHFRSLMEMLSVERERWVNFLRLPMRLPLLLLVVWSAGWALWRGRRGDRLLLILVLAAAVLMPLLVRVPHGRYLVVLVPALAALIWRALPPSGDAGGSMIGPAISHRWLRRSVVVGVLGLYAAMSLLPTLAVLYAYRGADYDRFVARLAAEIPPHARVMGHTMYWNGLHDRDFVSSIPPYFSDWECEADAVAHLEAYRPEYVIQSSHVFGSLGGLGPRPKDLRATPFGRACEQVAAGIPSQQLLEFYDPNFGAVRLWRFDWPPPPRR
ncbi:MAG: glycosyltransferase family 39 protein [Phycisphaerae bacterium]|jgi:hypothetical protein